MPYRVGAAGSTPARRTRAARSMSRIAQHGEDVGPLSIGGKRVLVDGHAICAVCGHAVEPRDPARWRHARNGRPRIRRSKWLPPVPLGELLKLETYEEFAARCPWTVRPELGAAFVTSSEQWREAA